MEIVNNDIPRELCHVIVNVDILRYFANCKYCVMYETGWIPLGLKMIYIM